MRGRGMVTTGGLSFGFAHPLPYHSGKEGWRTALNFYELRDNLMGFVRTIHRTDRGCCSDDHATRLLHRLYQ